MIYGACENTLQRRFYEVFAIWRPEAIRGPAHEGLDPAHLGAAERIEIGEFDDSHAARLHNAIFATQVCQLLVK